MSRGKLYDLDIIILLYFVNVSNFSPIEPSLLMFGLDQDSFYQILKFTKPTFEKACDNKKKNNAR